MKDGRIIQIGTPEQIVTAPADDYVREFVQGISRLKLVFARTIMIGIENYRSLHGTDLGGAPRTSHTTDLDGLIDISTTTDAPIVVQDDDSQDIGVIDKATLLKGIQGGKA